MSETVLEDDHVVWSVTIQDSEGHMDFTGLALDAETAKLLVAEQVTDYFGEAIELKAQGRGFVGLYSEDGYAQGTVILMPEAVKRVKTA